MIVKERVAGFKPVDVAREEDAKARVRLRFGGVFRYSGIKENPGLHKWMILKKQPVPGRPLPPPR
jgi:hypothetical protein